jgi:hypothetical protein
MTDSTFEQLRKLLEISENESKNTKKYIDMLHDRSVASYEKIVSLDIRLKNLECWVGALYELRSNVEPSEKYGRRPPDIFIRDIGDIKKEVEELKKNV